MDWTAPGRPPPIVTGPMRTFVEARGPPDPSWELVMMGSVYAGSGRGSNGRGILGAMSSQVRDMFASIARRYDHGNQVLSMGLHPRWRRAAVLLSGASEGD